MAATAPTEAEIREILAEAEPDIGELISEFTNLLAYVPPGSRGPAYTPGLWDDLRPSQENRLLDLLDNVYEELKEAIRKMIEDRVVAAALAFAAEFPDAPRAQREAAA